MDYCASPFFYTRRNSRQVIVGDPDNGGVIIGGNEPVVKQSMLTSDTLDTEKCVLQTIELVSAGCQIVRITAQTVRHAANLEHIVSELRKRGCLVPIVADIHFKPEAAMEAVKWVEMVRINPGNYADSKKFKIHEYSDEEYVAELKRIREKFVPLVELCKKLDRAMRIGTNHGSLSDRIMNRFGDTPLGMVESALEFARIARDCEYHNFKFSMKSSNPKIAIECYRLLSARLAQEGEDWNYPIHLGVTEAGEGEDGRIKSAIGIGSLLCDGLGDTIRVSLTEDSPNEIAVCANLLEQIPKLSNNIKVPESSLSFDPYQFSRRRTTEIQLSGNIKFGGDQTIRVVVTHDNWNKLSSRSQKSDRIQPEAIYEKINAVEADPRERFVLDSKTQFVTVPDNIDLPAITAFRLLASGLMQQNAANPILLKDTLKPPEPGITQEIALLRASVVIGSLLSDGIGDAILIRSESNPELSLRLSYNILQAAGCRSFKTDYVACPSCGRTLFDLQDVTAQIKARTDHLIGVKIAIMGCIVNGPGEMADADFGYVGGAPGKINLYVGKQAVKFNIPEVEAVDKLVDLIKEHGKWVNPVEAVPA
ncbi:MAG: (E)-4-hydroxy-3-methylbut-2-enyl-diphosphate synthase [Verrucomicrobiota bacterium]|nr:(E)-4-hydroxy-3-methylbut-2-enyl-diphosphate synthase [Verrucomicrobiota bacterium]